jgi:hypothetical protein
MTRLVYLTSEECPLSLSYLFDSLIIERNFIKKIKIDFDFETEILRGKIKGILRY